MILEISSEGEICYYAVDTVECLATMQMDELFMVKFSLTKVEVKFGKIQKLIPIVVGNLVHTLTEMIADGMHHRLFDFDTHFR